MKTFNLISYSTGRIRKTVKAQNLTEATNKLALDGYDVLDDYFVEDDFDTNIRNLRNLEGRTIYNEQL